MAAEDWFDTADLVDDEFWLQAGDQIEEEMDERLPFTIGRRQFQGGDISQPEFGRFKPKDVKNMRIQIPLSRVNLWRTAGGEVIQIHAMTDSHLLATIHMFERNRERDLAEIERKYASQQFADPNVYSQMKEHYSEYPAIYHAMVQEGCKRRIIARNYELQNQHDLLCAEIKSVREHNQILGKKQHELIDALKRVTDALERVNKDFESYQEYHLASEKENLRFRKEIEELKQKGRPIIIDSLTSLIAQAMDARKKKALNKKAKRNARSKSRSQSKKKSARKKR